MTEIKRKREKGVTLIELMIVLVIAAILVGGVYTLFATQQRSYFVQDQVAGVQQDARAALTIMARDIRMAGFMTGSEGFNVNGFSFAVNPANNGTGGIDSITVVIGVDELLSGGNPVTVTNINGQNVTLSAPVGAFFNPDPQGYYVAFEGDQQVYVIGSIGTDTLNNLTPAPPVYLANVGARVFRIRAVTYQIQNNALQRIEVGIKSEPLAGDGATTIVEDLQFAYQVEGVDYWTYDGQVTGAEANDAAFPAGTDNADIKMVRVNIIVKTAVPDAEEASFFKPASEDHGQINADPGNRRRVYSTVVKMRNL